MSIAQLSNMSHVFLGLGIVLIIMDAILFYFLDINKAWHIITGRQMKNKSEKQKVSKRQRRDTQKIATQKLSTLSDTSKTSLINQTDYKGTEQETTDLGVFRIKCDVTFIHTTVKI